MTLSTAGPPPSRVTVGSAQPVHCGGANWLKMTEYCAGMGERRELSAEAIEGFIQRGFCTLEGAFSPGDAGAVRDLVWQRMHAKAGIDRNDPATWPEAYDIEERLDHPLVRACFPDRLGRAIEDLVGAGRWNGSRSWGLWPVNFRFGAGEPQRVPNFGWHVDGNWFRHTLDSPRQGLLLIGLFSDVVPRGGGTILAGGSHRLTARALARQPEGLLHRELFEEVLRDPLGDFHEVTGAAGDVVLCHPFLFHTRGFKQVGEPRFMSNAECGLTAPMDVSRSRPGDHSPLEWSIRSALEGPPPAWREGMKCRF
jgi:hypothetical protein